MTGHTPTWQLPYPEPADYVSDSQTVMQELAEKIDAALSQVTASDTYTIPGTLVQTFTTSGTFTPPPGVTVVSVVVIGGGGNGGRRMGTSGADMTNGAGGSGGGVRVYRDVPVSGPVAVTIGGAGTESTFGDVSAPAGRFPQNVLGTTVHVIPAQSPNPGASAGGCFPNFSNGSTRYWNGQDGVSINGTYYAGGGGGGGGQSYYNTVGAGGAGGGGNGAAQAGAGPGNGTNGYGGGGGGCDRQSGDQPGGVGGSGRVMVYTEQAYKSTRNVPAPIDPEIDAALNVAGVIIGLVAVDPADPQAPGIPDATLVAYPDSPQPTGRMLTVPVDPDDPDGPTHEVPETAWPVAGWTYRDGTWTPPTTGEDTP